MMTHVFAEESPAMRPLSAAAIAGSLVPVCVVFDAAVGAALSARGVELAELHALRNSAAQSAAPKLTCGFAIG
jgi:hypothetical protein